ncbi:hypothetical protein G7Y79_00047g083220 [Physcia stellaris]|nr:hypothetical protein G7Y79_00047g083220 [Physcia stellaris]
MATTPFTLMTAEPDRAYTVATVQGLVRSQGDEYLSCLPYRTDADYSFWLLMDRLMAEPRVLPLRQENESNNANEARTRPPPTRTNTRPGNVQRAGNEMGHRNGIPIKGKSRAERGFGRRNNIDPEAEDGIRQNGRRERARTVFPETLHEDTLLSLSSNLTYRINCIKQATRYADLLETDKVDCKHVDIEEWLKGEFREPGPESLKKQLAVDRIEKIVEEAELFEAPPKGGKEKKATIYLAIALIQAVTWQEAYKDPSTAIKERIRTLSAKRHEVLYGNIYHSAWLGSYPGLRQKDKSSCPGLSESVGSVEDRGPFTPATVIRGF